MNANLAIKEEQLALAMEQESAARQSAEPLIAWYREAKARRERLQAEIARLSGYAAAKVAG